MGGRSSKTKPARSPGKNQNQDATVVETFDMGAVDEVQTGSIGDSVEDMRRHAHEDSGVHEKQAAQSAVGRGGGSSSMVHDIWEGKADNNLAPLSSLYGTNVKPLELQVSSSEDEDDDAEPSHGKKKKKARKKRKSKSAADKSSFKLSALKPVKPPPAAHPPGQQQAPVSTESQVAPLARGAAAKAASGEKDPPPAVAQDTAAASKADSPSRFFGFDGWKMRMSSSRSIPSTRERERSTREKERSTREKDKSSSGSPEKAAPLSSNPKTGAASLERFMEWKEGTYRSSGRESSTRLSEMSADESAGDSEADEVEDFDTLERETASAMAPTVTRARTPRRSLVQNQNEQLKASEKRAAAPSPAASVRSQRSARSAGRNLNIDDFDENIMNDILAEESIG